jgi:predicted N-acyltransferase
VDAYGDYSSWEDFLTPLSQNKRKRQELDKIEKRKIALRGLHNLINNLG